MKALIALTVAALGIGLSPAASAQDQKAPPPKSWPGVACLVGLAPPGCETVFENPTAQGYSYCAEEYVWRRLDGCPSGPLETVVYLGTSAAGYDVYGVNWMNSRSIYILQPPGPDGKVRHAWARSAFGVNSLAGETLYTRPKENGSVD